jgi:5S rRNA maturation endonuclease (ribonuclease M5)
MNITTLISSLDRIGIELKPDAVTSRSNWVVVNCCFAEWFHPGKTDNHPSLGLNVSDLKNITFKCWSCGESGKLWELFEAYAALKKTPESRQIADVVFADTVGSDSLKARIETFDYELENVEKTKPKIFPNEYLDRFESADDFPIALNYLRSRHIPAHLVECYSLLFDAYRMRLVFPIFSVKGELVAAQGRAISSSERNKYFFYWKSGHGVLGGVDKCKEKNKSVIVVEGFIDLLRIVDWADARECDVICTFSTNVDQAQVQKIISLDKCIQIWYDNDKAGRTGRKKLVQAIERFLPSLRIANLPEGVDPADMTEDIFDKVFLSTRRSVCDGRMV